MTLFRAGLHIWYLDLCTPRDLFISGGEKTETIRSIQNVDKSTDKSRICQWTHLHLEYPRLGFLEDHQKWRDLAEYINLDTKLFSNSKNSKKLHWIEDRAHLCVFFEGSVKISATWSLRTEICYNLLSEGSGVVAPLRGAPSVVRHKSSASAKRQW